MSVPGWGISRHRWDFHILEGKIRKHKLDLVFPLLKLPRLVNIHCVCSPPPHTGLWQSLSNSANEIAVSNWPNSDGICLFDSIPHDSLGAVSSPHLKHFSYHQDVSEAGGKRKPRRICVRIKLFLNYLSVRKTGLRFSTNICGSVTCTWTFKVRKPESFPKVTEKVQLTQPAHQRREINGRGCPSLPQQHTLPCWGLTFSQSHAHMPNESDYVDMWRWSNALN